MVSPVCVEELLRALPGDALARLFEGYARGNFRVDGVCHLVLHGPPELRVRALLPRVLPVLVSAQSMRTVEDLCTLLEEPAQSLFAPQLPYILSAAARQPEESMDRALAFVSERVYGRQVSVAGICDASLGQALVLILWDSVSPRGHEVLTGNRRSPKWEEYSPLLRGSRGDEGCPLDHARLLAAIALLFELVPQSLYRFAPKVLEFLHSASEVSGFHPGSVRCWQLFVQHVGVARLRPLLPAVVTELLRLATQLRLRAREGDDRPCEVLLGSVVGQACQQHADLVAKLPPLPPWPELSAARAAVGSAWPPTQRRGQTPEAFGRQLEAGVEQLEGAAQQAVRRAALEHVTALVESQRCPSSPTRVTQLGAALLCRLMRALLSFLWESSAWPDDQLMCGRLLGALGAIDPARLPQLDLGSTQLARTPADLGNAELLAKRVLTDFLVPSLTSKNSYAFAAQEILKYLQARGRDAAMLAHLSEDVRETLRPYTSSSYQLVEPAEVLEDTHTFDGVVAHAVGLTHGEHRALFLACLPAAHGNHALSLFLMHHVLHNLLVKDSRAPTEKLQALGLALAGLLDSQNDATAQAVFSLVDDLIERREQLFLSAGHDRAQPADTAARERVLLRVQALQSPITHRHIVSASVRCGAHARALRSLEQALIEEHQGPGTVFDAASIESEEDCLLVHSIYRDLDELDSALGALRAGPATAKTRTLRFELEGRWQDAQSLYEVQLASAAREGEARRELLCRLAHCPHNMRRFESSLRLVEGMEVEDVQAKLRPLAVEAAWQLGSWDRLEQALARPAAREADDFQVRLGQALLEFHRGDSARLEGALRDATLSVTQTVASAARESYTRAYQHLLKLHVVSDLSWLAARRTDAGSAPPAPGELAAWLMERAEVVAPTLSARQLVLSPLRTALEDMGLADDCKRVELAVARLCRKHGAPVAMEHPAVSFGGLGVRAETLARAQLEWGKLLYAGGSHHDALRHMQQLAPRSPKARLLGARWATEPASELLIPRVAEAEFKAAKEGLPADEAACFYHAAYLDRLLKEQLARRGLASAPGPQAERSPFDVRNLVTFTLRGYLDALRRGTNGSTSSSTGSSSWRGTAASWTCTRPLPCRR
ncbi:unnamed protein product [Prorocentrum cordatum]|uniref:Non-specific serine/threonine protein kinase n=1 Tax=Prorocentrum cordatum TaxID=2364126 RepID=A0ABN9S8P3_9DINO|nr:unnamed protein product [Polarella glacialis]